MNARRYAFILGGLSAALAVLALVLGATYVDFSAANQGFSGDSLSDEAQEYFRVVAFAEATRAVFPWVVFALIVPGVAAVALLARAQRRIRQPEPER